MEKVERKMSKNHNEQFLRWSLYCLHSAPKANCATDDSQVTLSPPFAVGIKSPKNLGL